MHHRADGERNKSNGLRDLVIMATPPRNCISSSDLPPVSPRYFTWKRHVIQNATGSRALNIVPGDVCMYACIRLRTSTLRATVRKIVQRCTMLIVYGNIDLTDDYRSIITATATFINIEKSIVPAHARFTDVPLLIWPMK